MIVNRIERIYSHLEEVFDLPEEIVSPIRRVSPGLTGKIKGLKFSGGDIAVWSFRDDITISFWDFK